MPKLSDKAIRMPPSPIRKLVPYADQAKKRGMKVYHLNIGQPDIETPPIALEGTKAAIETGKLRVIEYSHSAGILSFRKKLVEYYHRFGIELTPDEIIVTNGGSEAILFAMQVCLNPGDEILIPEPYYANYNGFAISAGVVVRTIPSSIQDGFALPPIAEFEKALTPRTKAIMVCNPNNPTGYLYSREELHSIRDIVKKHDLFLFADEVYREFCYDGKEHFSAMNLPGIEQNVVMLDSVSKRYSMCGARIGCFISKNQEVMQMALKFAQARLSPPTFGQIAAEAAIDTPPAYFEKVLAEYVQRRDVVVAGLNRIPGAFCPKPTGAFYAVAKLPIDNADRFSQWLLESFDYQGQTVMVAPASGFYAEPTSGTDEIRISYVLKVDDLKAAMTCLAEAVKVYPGRR